MPKRNNISKSQYPSPGSVTNQNIHTHSPTLGQSSTMSVNVRERSGHGAGRRCADPTRTQDPDGVLMGDGGTDVETVSSHGGVGSATGDNYGSVVVVGQHQVTGTGSGYYLRGGQPRQLQSQLQGRHQGRQRGQLVLSEDVGAGGDVDGLGVGASSGSDVDDLDTTFEGDDPVEVVQRPLSLIGDQCITPERRQSSLVGGSNVTEVQLRSMNDSSNAMPERRQSNLIGSLQTTEEQRRPAAAAVCSRGESITGFKPHSSSLSSDGNCSDSVDYSRIQQVMDLVRNLTEDDDDVIHPSGAGAIQQWRSYV